MINLFKINKITSLVVSVGLLSLMLTASDYQVQPTLIQGVDFGVANADVEMNEKGARYNSAIESRPDNKSRYSTELISNDFHWSVGYTWSDEYSGLMVLLNNYHPL